MLSKATYNYTKIKTAQVLCGNQNHKRGTTNMKTKSTKLHKKM